MKCISLVGIERAGKGTVIAELKKVYGEQIVFVNEPGSAPRAEIFRAILKPKELGQAETLVADRRHYISTYQPSSAVYYHTMMAARYDLFENRILKLQDTEIVFSDRGHLCTLAYQCFAQGMMGHIGDWQANYYRLFVDNRVDDLHVYLHISPEESCKRKDNRRSEDAFDEATLDFYRKVDQGYVFGIDFVNSLHRGVRGLIINGELSEEEVFREIRDLVVRVKNK